MRYILLSTLALFLISCGNDRQVEKYDLSGGITLTEDNHDYGYGENECFSCHVRGNIHIDNQTGSSLITLARDLTTSDGLSSCSTCHGTNGL
jgi:hypothetical protein